MSHACTEEKLVEQVLGYLNFSSGSTDVQVLSALNQLFADRLDEHGPKTWRSVGSLLEQHVDQLEGRSAAFSDPSQARAVLGLTFDEMLPAYLKFHRDLLGHQSEGVLFNAFFVGRCFETILRQGVSELPSDAEQRQALIDRCLQTLNDYIGHRPVAALETRKLEPYAHEWVRPVPLFIRGAGAAAGPHREVVNGALRLLEKVDPGLLQTACFDLEMLDELAFDPRSYDFDHPVNRRPNYHFGQWDPHHIDNRGYYRRFVIQQVTLDALMKRLEDEPKIGPDELLFEASAVLAGTMLMASGISGWGPEAHDSNVSLASLMPRIAGYRDAFYEQLYTRAEGEHAERLKAEAKRRRQPFGGARQHLNAQLARRRAEQLITSHLARIFARMGQLDAAADQSGRITVASVRMRCRIDCWLTEAERAIKAGHLEQAAELPAKIVDLLRRAIESGAIVDPWNILGFDGHFSLFPALENSAIDHRIEELVELIDRIFGLYAALWSEAAAVDDAPMCQRVSSEFRTTAEWWRQFAAHEVAGVGAVDPIETYEAAQHVAHCLNLWHRGGASVGDVAFWAPHTERFDSPKAYALVVEALLDRDDFVGSMALLIRWLSHGERVPLEKGDSSFCQLLERWILQLRCVRQQHAEPRAASSSAKTPDGWPLVRKFLDYLEANAEAYWQVPQFDIDGPNGNASKRPMDDLFDDAAVEEDEQQELFGAAYEDMVYRDSTDDGVDGPVFEQGGGFAEQDGLTAESERLAEHLMFLGALARIWRLVAVTPELGPSYGDPASATDCLPPMERWLDQAGNNVRQLLRLMESIRGFRIPDPTGDHESMVEYDRMRLTQESLLERIIGTTVETADAARVLLAGCLALDGKQQRSRDAAKLWAEDLNLSVEEQLIADVFAAVLRRDTERICHRFDDLLADLENEPLLYVPLAKGGRPDAIVASRVRQRGIQDLLAWLPRLGLLVETCRLIETAREMERNNPVGPGAVTEFDELFKIGYKSIVETLVLSAQDWDEEVVDDGLLSPNAALVECLETITESLLVSWLAHSRTLRLSVLERVHDRESWKRLIRFIQAYGGDLFSQRFLNMGNLRAILHHGVDAMFQRLENEPAGTHRLIDAIASGEISRHEAHEQLTLVLEAIVENYAEYRDYNSTTTQSDRGEMLFTLLDFLRLRTRYDRICWNLKPVVMAHETLVRQGREEAAQMWRLSLTERISTEATVYLRRLKELQRKHAMQMPTIADRVAERFVRPMAIDRIRSLVEPAIAEADAGGPHPSFDLLQQEIGAITRQPTGVGLDVPTWLLALDEEVERCRHPWADQEIEAALSQLIPLTRLSQEEAEDQIDDWTHGDDALRLGEDDDDDDD